MYLKQTYPFIKIILEIKSSLLVKLNIKSREVYEHHKCRLSRTLTFAFPNDPLKIHITGF